MKILRKIAELPLTHRIALAVAMLAAMIFGFWNFIYSDISVERAELAESVEATEDKIIQQQKIAKNLSKYKSEVKDMDERLGSVLRELPDKKEIEAFLRSISVLAVDTGLEVLEFTPQGEKREQYFASLPVFMRLEGSFHQLVTFFDEIAHLPRIVNIDTISVQILNETPEEVIVQVTCNATTYRYLDESERPSEDGEEDGGNRRRRR